MIKKIIIKFLQNWFYKFLNFKPNNFHPLVWISGNPLIGKNVYIGGFSELNCKNSVLMIGDNSDISSFVSINCADSHKKTIGISSEIERKEIYIGKNVFIGTHCVIKGNTTIGNFSVLASGTVIGNQIVPEYSLVFGNPARIKVGYYKKYKQKNLIKDA